MYGYEVELGSAKELLAGKKLLQEDEDFDPWPEHPDQSVLPIFSGWIGREVSVFEPARPSAERPLSRHPWKYEVDCMASAKVSSSAD